MSRNPMFEGGEMHYTVLTTMDDVPSEVITCACSAVKVVADDFIHPVLTKL